MSDDNWFASLSEADRQRLFEEAKEVVDRGEDVLRFTDSAGTSVVIRVTLLERFKLNA